MRQACQRCGRAGASVSCIREVPRGPGAILHIVIRYRRLAGVGRGCPTHTQLRRRGIRRCHRRRSGSQRRLVRIRDGHRQRLRRSLGRTHTASRRHNNDILVVARRIDRRGTHNVFRTLKVRNKRTEPQLIGIRNSEFGTINTARNGIANRIRMGIGVVAHSRQRIGFRGIQSREVCRGSRIFCYGDCTRCSRKFWWRVVMEPEERRRGLEHITRPSINSIEIT